jgi:hypothetical protein
MLGGGSCWVMGIKPSIYGDMVFLWDYYGDLFFGVAIGIHVMGYNDIFMECNGDIIWDM